MSKYNRKKTARAEDEFVDFWQGLFQKAEPYARAIAVSAATAVAVVVVFAAGDGCLEHRRQAATELFGRASRTYEADLLTDAPVPKSDEENPIQRYRTEKERAEATLREVETLEKRYPRAAVTAQARLLRAGVLFDLARYEDASAAYAKALEKTDDPPLRALAREGIGLCREVRGQFDEALAAYRELEPKAGDFYRDRALYDQARVLVKKGDKKKAEETYKAILAKMPGTALREEIQTRLAMLEGQ